MNRKLLAKFVDDCHHALEYDSDDGVDVARKYLFKRGLSEDTIKAHRIGYCSADMKVPYEIQTYGSELLNADAKKKHYTYFIKERVIVPIYEEFGLVEGFATRRPSYEKDAVWWNLPLPFHKGNHLFLMDKARRHAFNSGKIYVVEGYADALTLFQAGLTNVVALMGTALTLRKIGLIARYCDHVCLCLDVDKNQSGQRAKAISVAMLHRFGFCKGISVIDDMPEGEDPDSFVRSYGLQEFTDMEKTLTDSDIQKIKDSLKKRGNGKGKGQ